MSTIASRVAQFGTNIFTEISDLAQQHHAIDLGQGMPDFDGPSEAIVAYARALQSGEHNQYAPARGALALRQAVARHAQTDYGLTADPDKGVLITPGATNALFVATMGLVDPGDEVVIIEPFFDVYAANVILAGATPVYVPLRPPNWTFDPAELRAAFSAKTRLIIVNTPHNPTGRVFTLAELTCIAELCQKFDVTVIFDEVYEKLLFAGVRHIPFAALPGMFERTITIGSAGKLFGMTGWMVGWAYGPPDLIRGLFQAYQFAAYTVNHPAQMAVAHAFTLPEVFAEYYARYAPKRDLLLQGLRAAGIKAYPPEGAYFIMADFSDIFAGDDIAFARHLITQIGVACIPPSAFFGLSHRHIGSKQARFSFCKSDATLREASERLARLRR